MEQDLKTYLDRKQERKIQKTLTKQCTFSCDTTLMALQLYVKHFYNQISFQENEKTCLICRKINLPGVRSQTIGFKGSFFFNCGIWYFVLTRHMKCFSLALGHLKTLFSFPYVLNRILGKETFLHFHESWPSQGAQASHRREFLDH